MKGSKARKPATALTVNGLPETLQLGGSKALDATSNTLPAQTLRSPQPEPRGKTRVLETLAILREWHPAAFVALTEPRRPPLKRGIHADIVARLPAIRPLEARAALAYYCGWPRYLRVVTEGATRIDLDGAEAGVVTAEEAAYARTRIAAIKKRLRERKAAAKPVGLPTPAAAAKPILAPKPPPPLPTPTATRPPSGPVVVVRLKRRGPTS